MKCPACGRTMEKRETLFVCSNRFCDYEEDFESPAAQPATHARAHEPRHLGCQGPAAFFIKYEALGAGTVHHWQTSFTEAFESMVLPGKK